jgi:hypothetical protein
MSWRMPEFWIEVDSYTVRPLLRANTLFATQRWKTFLLGHQKYGPKASWQPEKELKGLPQDVSENIKREAEECNYSYATYYTLNELEEIDLDEEMRVPTLEQLERNKDNHKYGVKFEIIKPDGEEYGYFPWNALPAEKRVDAIENGSVKLEGFLREGSFSTNAEDLVKDSERMSREDTPEPEKVTVTLDAEVKKKKDYATDFQEMIDLLNELRTSEDIQGNFNIQKGEEEQISKEDFRLVIWV